LVSKWVIVGGLAVAAVAGYVLLKGTGQSPQNANPTSVQTPVSVTPSSLFNSTPSLSTGGSGSGNFTLAQTYSPYYSTSNTYTNTTTQTTTSNPQTSIHLGIF
jgi:hypothetical protein